MFVNTKQNFLNIVILFLLFSTLDCSKMLKKSKLSTGWSNRWMLWSKYGAYIPYWSTEELCEKECPKKECYRLKRYSNYRFILPYDSKPEEPWVCFFYANNELADPGKASISDGENIRITHNWTENDECNAFCRGMIGKLCTEYNYKRGSVKMDYYGCPGIRMEDRKNYFYFHK